MIYIGIDPGFQGALAALDEDGKLIWVYDTPTIQVKRSGGRRTEYLPKGMAALLENFRQRYRALHICLELVNAMPGQGVRSMFSMGRGVGTWEGIVAAMDLPLEYVTPQVWKRAMGLIGSEKAASILKAQQLVPGSSPYLTLKKHDGRAEAILIAEYSRRLAH